MSFAPWIKIETTTPDKPEVIAIAAKLRMKDPDAVTGKLIRLWAWADANSIDGHSISITRSFIDRLTLCKGFAAALESVGWLRGSDGLLSFPGFDRHNGESAKKRATETRKKQKQRGAKPPPDVPNPTGQMSPKNQDKQGDQEEEIEYKREREAREGNSEMGTSPPPPAEDTLVTRVNSLRPGWASAPVLSAAEAAALAANRPALASLAPETWDTLRRYLHTRLPEGSPGWQPMQRLKFLQTSGDVVMHAVEWDRKQKPASSPKPTPPPVSTPKLTREEIRKALRPV